MKTGCRRMVCAALDCVIAVLLAAGAGGCAGAGGGGTGGRTKHVAFVVPAQLNFAVQMAEGFKAGAARVDGVTAETVGPDIVDGFKELQMFQGLTERAKDGISVFTLTPEIFTKPMADAVKNDIPLIAVDNPPLATSGVKLFVGNDNYRLGKTLADQVIAELPANTKGKIVLGTSTPGVKVLDRRARGMRDEIKAKLPGVRVMGPFDTKQEVGANLDAWTTLTEVNKDALAFLGTGDADGWNLAAIREKRKATWVAGAFDLDPKSLEAVKKGQLVLVSPEHFMKGEVAGYLQAEHAKSGEALPEGWLYTPGLAVNSSNVDAIIERQKSTENIAKDVASEVDAILNDATYLKKLSDVS